MSISPADFELVRDLVRTQSGIALSPGKEYLVEARLAPIAEREGVDSVTELIGRMRRSPSSLTDDVVAAIATNETSFFRDLHPFEALRDEIIPRTVARRGTGPAIWCGAASTGQEPYSVALLMQTSFSHLTGGAIVATDLSEDVLDRAASGRFTQLEVNRGLPAAMLVRWFTRDGTEWVLSDSVRRRVDFRRLNLVRPFPPMGPFDVVLLRNVLIYFDVPMKIQVLEAVAEVMRPGGYLLLGAAETTYGLVETFERAQVGRTVCYRLRSDA